ncbi:MAG: cyclodeaminase/cyclohydrolase family protein, partial [Chloroflexota bacterium]|nr:cyclodeaminase/cyclohydrolase family protein [Chloroflexota bacterium]
MSDSPRLSDLTLNALLDRLASSDPVPGGGSAAALAGAMGAGLVVMVAELTIGRPEYAEHDATVADLRTAARARKDLLLELAEEDAVAYDAVVSARRLPKESEPEREARATALRGAMVDAARVPLRTAVVASEVLELAERIAPIGNRNAVSDAGVAAQLAAAALRGALLNVRINLPYLAADEPMRLSAPGEISRLEAFAAEHEHAALDAVDTRLL